MATLTAVNPRVVKGHMETVDMLVTNGQSWSAGQFLTESSGALIPCATDAADIKYYALEDQADPGNATTTAKVAIITDDILFEINELDGAVTNAAIGVNYGINVASNVVTMDITGTNNTALAVADVGSQYNRLQNAAADVKGRCKVRVLQSVIDA